MASIDSSDGSMPNEEQYDLASEWFVRLRAPSVAQATLREFSLWLAESPAHQDAFDAVARQFEGAGTPPAKVIPLSPRRLTRRWLWGVAAAACLALAIVTLLPGGEAYRTAIGEQLAVQLEDGSEVRLNTDSHMRVRLSEARRDVRLERGEAFFRVAKDAGRPFVVTAGDVTVTAVGTAFNVYRSPEGIRVALAEGKVRVAADADAQYDLLPGEVLLLAASGAERAEVPPSKIAPWRRHMLVYEDVRLEDLVADLNRYLPARMTVDEPLRDERVSAVLRIGEQNVMLDALTKSLDVHWTEIARGRILLYAKPGRAS